MKCKIEIIHPDAVIPEYAHNGDSGMDVYAVQDAVLDPGKRIMVPLGFKVQIPPETELQMRPKSGLAINEGITVLNTPGTIDSNFRGEVCVILLNTSDKTYTIKAGRKVAQMVLCPVYYIDQWCLSSVQDSTSRGEGGFGSTGI